MLATAAAAAVVLLATRPWDSNGLVREASGQLSEYRYLQSVSVKAPPDLEVLPFLYFLRTIRYTCAVEVPGLPYKEEDVYGLVTPEANGNSCDTRWLPAASPFASIWGNDRPLYRRSRSGILSLGGG